MPTVATICDYLNQFAPRDLAAEWDNVGLLVGDYSQPVTRVLTCLTVTREVVEEAVRDQVQLIVSHHPVLFRGTKRLTSDSGEGRLIWPLARAGIAVYSPHTAFDNTSGGINDFLAQAMGLEKVEPLRRCDSAPQYKVVVFVPENDLKAVSEAMFQAGAGIIGDYEQCSYRLSGTGTFFGTDSTNPTIGQRGHREEVSEWRLEVVCPERQLARVLAAMRKAHSYEEPAYDVYPLKALPSGKGEGRIGELPSAVPLKQLAATAKQVLLAGGMQIVGDLERSIRRVAIACGAAGEFLSDAVKAKADLFLTGEMRFHDYLSAQNQGIALLLPGHYASERPAVEALAGQLKGQFGDLEVWASRSEKDPVSWI
jgi:dinuclear metal center YbgI/SA1388 family protein